MAPSLKIIDPDGDTLIILSYVDDSDTSSEGSSESDWESDTSSDSSSESGSESESESENGQGGPQRAQQAQQAQPTQGVLETQQGNRSNARTASEASNNEAQEVPPADDVPMEIASAEDDVPMDIVSPEDEDSMEDVSPSNMEEEMHFKVSMKHLSLASSRAKSMFTGPYLEAQPHPSDGLRHWTFEAMFKPSSFGIVLRIIHSQTDRVPRVVTLEQLANVAAVVDDLGCHSSVTFFAQAWIKRLKLESPKSVNIRLVQMILVSSVFHAPSLFESSTKQAILHAVGPLQPLGYPIRPDIIDRIEVKRQALLEKLIDELHQLMETLSQETPCTMDCTSITLGGLIRHMREAKLTSPRPSRPFEGVRLYSMLRMVRKFQSSRMYVHLRDCTHKSLLDYTYPILQFIEQKIGGLVLP